MRTFPTINFVTVIKDLPVVWVIDRDQRSLHLLILSTIRTKMNIFVPMANGLSDWSKPGGIKVNF